MSKRFRRWFSTRPRQVKTVLPPARSRRARPDLEALEDRVVPATFNVNSTADILNPPAGVVTLRSAIKAANATPGGNTINLTVPGLYTITLAGTPGETDNAAGEFAILPNGGNLTIVNTSGKYVAVNANYLNRVFDINPNDDTNPNDKFLVTLQGITIERGVAADPNNPDGPTSSGGGIRDQGNASLTLSGCTVTLNSATADGGGISMENTVSVPWTLTIGNSTISSNQAGDAGGGVETDGSGKVFLNSATYITGNSCVNQGAGVWLDAIPDPNNPNVLDSANLTLNNVNVSNNKALDGPGGGIGNAGNGAVSITGSGIINNFAAMAGGGFDDQNGQGTLSVTYTSFRGNTAFQGGGIEENNGTVPITTSDINGNTSATSGGGIFSDANVVLTSSTVENNKAFGIGGGFADDFGAGTLAVSNSIFSNNVAVGSGGGLAAQGPTTSISNSEFTGNHTGASGGAIFADGTTLLVTASTLDNNVASGNGAGGDGGGGIELRTTGGGFLTGSRIIDTTITGNKALNSTNANGGGIDAGPNFTGAVLLLNDTINANFASVGGGVFWAGTLGSAISVQNTIIARNTAAVGPDVASVQLYMANLNGAQPVPHTSSSATGTGSILLSADQTTITVNLNWTGLTGPPTAAQLRNAPAGVNDGLAMDANGHPIVFTGVADTATGAIMQQNFKVNVGVVILLQQGNIYTNIDTTAFPNGEIRGQFSVASGLFTDLGGNLIGVNVGVNSLFDGFTNPTTQSGTPAKPLNPLLGALGNNGGPTIGSSLGLTFTLKTEALLSGSPALGKGLLACAPHTDERGHQSVGSNGKINVGAVSST